MKQIAHTVQPDKRLAFNDWAKYVHKEVNKNYNIKTKKA